MKKPETVAYVFDRATAIDLSPIYYIEVTKKLKKGDIIRFDLSSNTITLEEKHENR